MNNQRLTAYKININVINVINVFLNVLLISIDIDFYYVYWEFKI